MENKKKRKVNRYRLSIVVLCAVIVFVIAYAFFLSDCICISENGKKILQILNDLSLAYIASMITLYFVQYKPNKHVQESAFEWCKHDLELIYSDIRFIIAMFLYEFKVDDYSQLLELPYEYEYQLEDKKKYCIVDTFMNGKRLNEGRDLFNPRKDSIKAHDDIKERISKINNSNISTNLEFDLISLLGNICNAPFMMFINSHKEHLDYNDNNKHFCINLPKHLYDFIELSDEFKKYNLDNKDYKFVKNSEHDAKLQWEEFMNRIHFQ